MKKAAILLIFMICLFSTIFTLSPIYAQADIKSTHIDTPYSPPSGSKEELYQDIFITLLDKCISKALEDYYGGWVPYDPWNIDVLNVDRPNGNRTTYFIIKLRVMPYMGAHNNIGIDQVTIELKSGEEPKVLKFIHSHRS